VKGLVVEDVNLTVRGGAGKWVCEQVTDATVESVAPGGLTDACNR